jgi:ABC-2 type transport system ATP-binding protein
MSRIVLDSVHKKFRRGFFSWRDSAAETHALKDISLDIGVGEVFGLLGPNGSGKSTTLKLISTVLLPDTGGVLVGGADTRAQAQAVRRQVGFALASERSFFPRLTARENLEFFAALENVPTREIRARLEFVLASVGLQDAADKQVMKLSSGMYQRLGIARALIKRPSVMLLDEPTRSLDAAATGRLWALINDFSNGGMTILLATHNFEEAAQVCNRIAVLQRGELLAVQRASNRSTKQLREFYLGITGGKHQMPWPEGVPA